MKTTHPYTRDKRAVIFACVLSLGVGLAAVPPEGRVFVPSPKEAELYRLILAHPDQKRTQVVLDPRLCQAAREHAQDTQRRKFFNHKNPDGENPNRRVLDQGYPLPTSYSPADNYVESMYGSSQDTPASVVAGWRGSTSHANHVFGLTAFYRGQVVFGVGQAPASGHAYATYVFVSAPLPVGEQGAPLKTPAPVMEITSGNIVLTALPPMAILEVWKSSGPTLNAWTLDRTTAIGTTGRMSVGQVSGRSGFFRLGYYRP